MSARPLAAESEAQGHRARVDKTKLNFFKIFKVRYFIKNIRIIDTFYKIFKINVFFNTLDILTLDYN